MNDNEQNDLQVAWVDVRQHYEKKEEKPPHVNMIGAIQFGILSPRQIRDLSVMRQGIDEVGITLPITYENNVPKRGGLCDLRMGPTERHYECQTCRGKILECPGHPGHIELQRDIYHPGFIRYVQKILRCVCFYCSRLLIDENDPKYRQIQEAQRIENKQQRLRKVSKICTTKHRCNRCDALQPQISLGSQMVWMGARFPDAIELYPFANQKPNQKKLVNIVTNQNTTEMRGKRTAKDDWRYIVKPEKAREVLSRISNHDCRILGLDPQYSRPEWMVLSVLHVPPPCVRPSVKTDSARGEDDVTRKLIDVIKANNDIAEMTRKDEDDQDTLTLTYKDREELFQKLQFHVALLFDNDAYGKMCSMQRGHPIKTLKMRLKGKRGRFRANLNGKRVNFSARDVISPDITLNINQIGVPKKLAMILTYPERVTRYNFQRLYELVKRGPNVYPGARYVIKKDSEDTLDLRYSKDPAQVGLQYGDIVERHLIDGDVVLFNRQPSLHKMSMMAHFANIVETDTFCLALSVTTPYNADFDGDEMNLHVPQGEEARAEALNLMMVQYQIISPQSNKPVIGLVQDELLGISLFTERDVFLNRDDFSQIIMQIEDYCNVSIDQLPLPCILKPKPLWTGKQIVSLLFPDTLTLKKVANMHPKQLDTDNTMTATDTLVNVHQGDNTMTATDTLVNVHQGELLSGRLCKRTAGTSGGGLIQVVFNDYSPEDTQKMIDGLARIANEWMSTQGYSIRVSDTLLAQKTEDEIDGVMQRAVEEVNALYQRGGMDAGKLETEINFTLNRALNRAGTILQERVSKNNNILRMIQAGSKGSFLNIAQILACVGQQNVEGQRIPFGYDKRTTVHMTEGDQGAESRGFVRNPYRKGLTPVEFLFHCMAGREGLIDTAVKTSLTGYIQRRLMKAMEDLMVHHDGTVRNSLGQIIQFVYGEDGLDGIGVEFQSGNLATCQQEAFLKQYIWTPNELKRWQRANNATLIEKERIMLFQARDIMQKTLISRDDDRIVVPVCLERMIQRAKWTQSSKAKRRYVVVRPDEAIQSLLNLRRKLMVMLTKGDENDAATTLFIAHVLAHLCSKKAALFHKFERITFINLLDDIVRRFDKSRIQAGEMVGPLAAQSLSAPATQMTLNTFHYAGISSKNMTSGIPRLLEIINVLKKTKTPSLLLFLRQGPEATYEMVANLAKTLVYTSFSELVQSLHQQKGPRILHDPDPKNSIVAEDRDVLQLYYSLPEETFADTTVVTYHPYCLRLCLRRDILLDKQLTMEDVAGCLREFLKANRNVLQQDFMVARCEDDQEGDLFVRIRPVTLTKIGTNKRRKKKDDSTTRTTPKQNTDAQIALLNQVLDLLSGEAVRVKGIKGIRTAFVRKEKTKVQDPGSGNLIQQQEYVIDTLGSNLEDIFECDELDPLRCISNEIMETYQTLGIEACRQLLYREIKMVLSFDYINYRHMSILMDVMTHRGYVMPITRFGLNRVGTGPLKRASFEETYDMLIDASLFSEKDNLFGISENIMTGNRAPMGTGHSQIKLTPAYQKLWDDEKNGTSNKHTNHDQDVMAFMEKYGNDPENQYFYPSDEIQKVANQERWQTFEELDAIDKDDDDLDAMENLDDVEDDIHVQDENEDMFDDDDAVDIVDALSLESDDDSSSSSFDIDDDYYDPENDDDDPYSGDNDDLF